MKAQYKMGVFFEKGQGIDIQDQDLQVYKNEKGDIIINYNAKEIENRSIKAANWYRKAAEQGYAEAQYKLGGYYEMGLGVERNYIEAAKWYRLAAEQGYAWAQNSIGECYYNGKGVEQNYTEAAKWYRLAAEQGNFAAKRNLGLCYYNGQGVEQNYDEAQYWLKKYEEQKKRIEIMKKFNS